VDASFVRRSCGGIEWKDEMPPARAGARATARRAQLRRRENLLLAMVASWFA